VFAKARSQIPRFNFFTKGWNKTVAPPLLILTISGLEAPMGDHEYFREKANRCYQIARTCMDLEAARKINELGNEFRSKASEEQSGRDPLPGNDRNTAA
jgi:hypothetical protein